MIARDSGRNLHKAIGNLLITTFSLAGWDHGAPTHSDVGGGLLAPPWPWLSLSSSSQSTVRQCMITSILS